MVVIFDPVAVSPFVPGAKTNSLKSSRTWQVSVPGSGVSKVYSQFKRVVPAVEGKSVLEI